MKISTFAIAVGPALILLAAKTVIEPMWLRDYSFFAVLAIGTAIGVFGGIAARIVEPRD